MKANDLMIEKLLRFSINEGKNYINNQRVVMIPDVALGTLRQDLIKNLGMDRTKGFLIRYGWNCGVSDALRIRKMKFDSKIDYLWAGPKMHSIHGHVQVQPTIIECDFEEGKLHFEGSWLHSYEASEHLRLFGKSDQPICHTLVGYASGYLTTIMDKRVVVVEKKCEGMGHNHCHWVAKTVEEWNGEVDHQLIYYEEQSLISELDQAYVKLKLEKENQDRAIRIHNKLIQEVVRGRNLQSIANVLSQFMEQPIIIEDYYLDKLAHSGIHDNDAQILNYEFKEWFAQSEYKKDSKFKTDDLETVLTAMKIKISDQHCRLIAPILLRNKVFGFCSVLFRSETAQNMDFMIMEQAAQACSMFLLNEQTAIETEQRVRGNFLEEILSNSLTTKEMLKRGHHIGFNLEHPYFFLAIKRYVNKLEPVSELELNGKLIIELTKYTKNKSINLLIGQKSGDVVLLLPKKVLEVRNLRLEQFCEELLNYCESVYDERFSIGVSTCSDEISEASEQYMEAVTALKLTGKVENRIMYFDSLGIVGVMFQSGNVTALKKYFFKLIGIVIDYDKKRQTDLTKTLYFFLKNGGNLENTANEMALSISGLRYRIQKIQKLLKVDIREPNLSYQYFLAIQALIVLGEINFD